MKRREREKKSRYRGRISEDKERKKYIQRVTDNWKEGDKQVEKGRQVQYVQISRQRSREIETKKKRGTEKRE
jgi:hypothetical protein